MQNIKIKDFLIGEKQPFTLIIGPCVIESEDHAFYCAKFLKELTEKLSIQMVFKASFDKANRSSLASFRGVGLRKGVEILGRIKTELDLPITTDIHLPEEALLVSEVADILQIPAFLCRQTDLIIAAAKTNRTINVKKGQFIAPFDMKWVVEKIESQKNHQIILTERGTFFGYNNLVNDFRGIPIMKKFGYPVCFDASHSVQLPGAKGAASGGERQYIKPLALAAIASGANLIFLEAHPDPKNAKSDAETVYPFDSLEPFLKEMLKIYQVIND